MSFQKGRKSGLLVFILLVGSCAALSAQQAAGTIDIAVTYNAARSLRAGTGSSFWQQGGSIEIAATAWKGLGIAANVTGLHASSVGNGGPPLSIVTATFGPRYRWHAGHKFSLYGQGLIGEANAFDTIIPTSTTAGHSGNSFAIQANGGVDMRLSHRCSLRLLDAGWYRTQLPNAAENVQNNLRLGAGVVFHLGS